MSGVDGVVGGGRVGRGARGCVITSRPGPVAAVSEEHILRGSLTTAGLVTPQQGVARVDGVVGAVVHRSVVVGWGGEEDGGVKEQNNVIEINIYVKVKKTSNLIKMWFKMFKNNFYYIK